MDFLPFSEDTNTSGSKFLLSCKEITDNDKTTKGWLDNVSGLSIIPKQKTIDMPNKNLLEAILNKNIKVVVKVANVEEDIETEWKTFESPYMYEGGTEKKPLINKKGRILKGNRLQFQLIIEYCL